jgi:uncharacterized protein YndB with AHSA1/START domain
MITVDRVLKTTPQRVWDVLADGWLYPVWVVGASRMREVDHDWPAVGSRIHHSVGVWPVLIDDDTEVTDSDPLRMLALRAKAWPLLGEAAVVLRLTEQGASTRVVMEEDVTTGPGKIVPQPIRAPGIKARNVETLRRLAFIAERR